MNIFDQLKAWYDDDRHSWTRRALIKQNYFDPNHVSACLVGGLRLVKFGSGKSPISLRRHLQTHHERRILRKAIRQYEGGRHIHSLMTWNDYHADRHDIDNVLEIASELWDAEYPTKPKPQRLLGPTKPFPLEVLDQSSQTERINA